MAYTHTLVYHSSLQDTITSICVSILPFFKNRRLPADRKLAKRHAESLKWQQDSFHRILNLIGLHKEGIVPEAEVSTFRSQLLQTLIASPAETELAAATRDKLLFLQELFYSKCISAEEYHSSKRPLLQRLAAQGAEIDSRDVIIGGPPLLKNTEEWTDIDLNDQEAPKAVEKCKEKTPLKLPWRSWAKKEGNKRKPFHSLFQGSENKTTADETSKNQWGFEGLKKWRTSSCQDESVKPYFLNGERSEDASPSNQGTRIPIGELPEKKRMKKSIPSDASDCMANKVLGDKIKTELSRIKSELAATNQTMNFSDGQIHEISTKLPVDKADLSKFFPKSWCDAYGDNVLDVMRKEFKDHVGEMENLRKLSKGKEVESDRSWMAFEDDYEDFHPNLFA